MKRLIPIIVLVLMAVTTVAIAADSGPAGVVNVNTATADELQLLPRVGPALAGRILDFRDANGPFERNRRDLSRKTQALRDRQWENDVDPEGQSASEVFSNDKLNQRQGE